LETRVDVPKNWDTIVSMRVTNISKRWEFLLLPVLISGAFMSIIPLFSAVCLGLILSFLYFNFLGDKRTPEDFAELESLLKEADSVMAEQEEVIFQYEGLLDSLSTSLPCNCGSNMIEGLFKPGVENFVKCEKCQSEYKVMVSFDSILTTEPMDIDNSEKEIRNKLTNS
jgi:hypothetical protein